MIADPIHIYRNKAGAYVVQHKGKFICYNWDRECAEGLLCHYKAKTNTKDVIGSWDT